MQHNLVLFKEVCCSSQKQKKNILQKYLFKRESNLTTNINEPMDLVLFIHNSFSVRFYLTSVKKSKKKPFSLSEKIFETKILISQTRENTSKNEPIIDRAFYFRSFLAILA